ncbi:MAG: ABC transporter ATP-binding protein [Nitrospirae bacterium]|nr:ABC transporter ATP-binding protein [Nitrospirota bacterium]
MREDIKRIFRHVMPYKKRMMLAAICSLIISGLNGTLAWLAKPAVDEVLVKGDKSHLIFLSLVIPIVFLGRGIFTYSQNYLMKSSGIKVVRDLRNSMYERMLSLPNMFFSGGSSGSSLSRIMNDTGVLQEVLTYSVKNLFVEAGTIAVLVSIAFWRRWDLTLMAIVVLPSAFYAVGKLGRRLKRASRKAQEGLSMITESIVESFGGIKIIKSFSQEKDEASRFRDKNQNFYREIMRATRITEFSTLIMELTGGLGIGLVLFYGGRLVIRGTITPGDFFSFLTAIFMIYTPAKRLATVSNSLHQSRAPLDRIYTLLNEDKERDGSVDIGTINKEIVFDKVFFRYPDKEDDALYDINLRVEKGEIIAIVGRSGAGKTTFVDLIPKFYSPVRGAIYIDGIDISKATLKSLRAQIGIVSQDVILFNDTVRANIAFGMPGVTEDAVINAAKSAYAHDFIMEFPLGYDTVIGERGIRLSGGQKQRLSIARAILKNPPILILDEATSSLDSASEVVVQKAIENLMGSRTIFVIAHRLSTVKRASRIIVLDKGRIVESGTHDELIKTNGIYKKLYILQFDDSSTVADLIQET